jgi:hypothetical protein
MKPPSASSKADRSSFTFFILLSQREKSAKSMKPLGIIYVFSLFSLLSMGVSFSRRKRKNHPPRVVMKEGVASFRPERFDAVGWYFAEGDQMATKLPTKWTPAETDQFFRERLEDYQGDSYLVDDLVETDQYTVETARREIGNLETLKAFLEFGALPDVLADRTACKALKDALLANRNDVIKLLMEAAKSWKKFLTDS